MPWKGANSVNQELNLLVVIKHSPAHQQQKVSLMHCKMGTQCIFRIHPIVRLKWE